jgi:hypothetical protein
MIDCALVDRDSAQIDCKPPESAGAGSDDRTRKRARGEAPEDYAKRDAFKAARGTRERLQSAPTAGITAHFFSVVYYALINVTRELALKPIYTNARRVYVFGPRAASDDELRARIELYDRGVDPELFVNLRNPLCWVPFNDEYLVCPTVGEVVASSTGQLIGCLNNKKVTFAVDGAEMQRSHVILIACKKPRKDGTTADHIKWDEPLNDSIDNLRWADLEQQLRNRRAWKRYQAQVLLSETISLPPHPSISGNFEASYDGKYKTRGQQIILWTEWKVPSPNSNTGAHIIGVCKKTYQIHRLMMECLIGRLLRPGEEVDHIDGDDHNNNIANLQLSNTKMNCAKRKVNLVTGGISNAVVYCNKQTASAETGISAAHICSCTGGSRKSAGGYSWRDSTVEEVEHFFRAMDALEDLPAAVASLASHPRHGELVRALELRREREAALARLGLCDPPVGWVRGTDGCSGLSFYHREETGECRWRNPTLTRLGL